jgi:dTDP-glucose 4,6-dehydratase
VIKVLVIGSNSFSGSSFVNFALRKNAKVLGISRSVQPIEALNPSGWTKSTEFQFMQLDLNLQLTEIIHVIKAEKPDYVVNFAAQSMVAESWDNPSHWFQTNAVATIALHDEIRKFKFIKRYVHVSTPEVYGSCTGFISEDRAFNPSTPYAVSRAAADMSLRTFYEAYDFPFVITRAANVYGPGQQPYRIIPRAILSVLSGQKIQLHGGGLSTRSFIHINDVCEATWRAMEFGKNGESYHIATDEVISIRDLVQMICSKLSVNFEDHVAVVGERLGKDAAYHLSSDKIKEELNWSADIGLENGLDECILWVKKYLNPLKSSPQNYVHKK